MKLSHVPAPGPHGFPRVGPSFLLEGKGPDQEEVAADVVHWGIMIAGRVGPGD